MNGIIGEVSMETQQAADNRHPPIIKHVSLASGTTVAVGELLFDGASGIGSLAKANTISNKVKGDASTTDFVITLGEIVPGSVEVTIAANPAIKENGAGALVENEHGTAKIDYATGTVAVHANSAPSGSHFVEVKAVSAGTFHGVANDTTDAGDDGVNVVVHGTVYEGIAKVNGVDATVEQLKFASRHGIY